MRTDRRGRRWTEREVRILRRAYPRLPTAALEAKLKRPITHIYAKANNEGIHKSAAYFATPASGRFAGRHGLATRFKPGNVPWNLGMSYQAGGRAAETQFKPGARPHSWLPIGSERITTDGLRQRKLTDTGYPPRDWVPVHRLLWESHHGPVPRGCLIVFRDRDRTHIAIDNLECITRAENMHRNTCHRYPKEVARLVQLRGALVRQINRRLHEKQTRRPA